MSQDKQLLVTGGTGFIGIPLCKQLAARGYAVTVLSRNPERAAKVLPRDVRVIASLTRVEADFSHVVNLAGEPLANGRWNETRKNEFYASRIGLTKQLVDFFQSNYAHPEVVVSGSAIGIYGHRHDEVLTEASPAGEGYAAMLCRDWEAEALRFSTLGSRVCLLRTGIVLGPDGGALHKMLPAFRLGLGGRMGDGQQWMSWVHRDDLIRIIIFCLEHQTLTGPVNGVAPQPVRNDVFAQQLARVLHRPALLPMPALALRLLFGEMAEELLLASQRVIPQASEQQGFTFDYPDLKRALTKILKNN